MAEILHNFYVLEGADGAGTTTQLNLLTSKLRNIGISCFATQEPTTLETGKFIRKILSGEIKANQSTIAYLFGADRDNHLYSTENGIIAHLNNGEIVVSDRYFFSSLAYQSIGYSYEQVERINSAFPYPEVVIYIDTPVEQCIQRIESRGNSTEIYEKRDFLNKLNLGYAKALSNLPSGCSLLRIDGNLKIDDISETIMDFVLKRIQTTR